MGYFIKIKMDEEAEFPYQVGHAEIIINATKKRPGVRAIVDRHHLAEIQSCKWHVSSSGYLMTHYLGRVCSMHQFVWCVLNNRVIPKGQTIDHVNNVHHDNRLENLRTGTPRQQGYNKVKRKNATSKYIGVTCCKRSNKWRVLGFLDGKRIHLGLYISELEAAYIYDRWLVTVPDFHEGFRKLNFPWNIDIYRAYPLTEYAYKRKKQSQYHGLYFDARKRAFVASVVVNRQNVRIGRAKDEIQAAKMYDRYVVMNNINKKINFPEDYPDYIVVPKDQKGRLRVSERDETSYFVHLSNSDKRAIIDKEDYDRCSQYTCILGTRGYVRIIINGHTTMMLHRFIMNVAVGESIIDHKNRDKLDCRKANLRRCDSKLNARNKTKHDDCKSRYIGVLQWGDKYVATFTNPDTKRTKRAQFKIEEHAGRFRDLLVMDFSEECFHSLNFEWTSESVQEWKTLLNFEKRKIYKNDYRV